MGRQNVLMSQSALLGFAAVSFAIIVVPGPSVLFAVSRAIASGRRVALLTVLGNASGLFVQVVLVAFGLGVVVTGSEVASILLKSAGATYLVWLGISAIRHRHRAAQAVHGATAGDSARPFRDGFVVGVTNPKSIVFLAALLPQWVEPGADWPAAQMIALGAVFCVVAVLSDGTWAMLAARARLWFASDPRWLAWTSVAGGLVMVGLGLLLLLS
jgi:threonine/homoserine/homoserine lactone efflux protein